MNKSNRVSSRLGRVQELLVATYRRARRDEAAGNLDRDHEYEDYRTSMAIAVEILDTRKSAPKKRKAA